MSARVISTNVAVRQPEPSDHDRETGIDKHPEPRIHVCAPEASRSGVSADFVGDLKHHGGPLKAVYAYAREELDYWEAELGRGLADGAFGENLTTTGIRWAEVPVGQRIKVGTAVLEASIPRQPCGTFQAWLGEKGWVKRFTQRGDCGSYFSVIEPGDITEGDALEFLETPTHGVTMGEAFAALMGNLDAARRVVAGECLPEIYHNQLRDMIERRQAHR